MFGLKLFRFLNVCQNAPVFFQKFLNVHDIIIDNVIFPFIHGNIDDGNLVVVENWVWKCHIIGIMCNVIVITVIILVKMFLALTTAWGIKYVNHL